MDKSTVVGNPDASVRISREEIVISWCQRQTSEGCYMKHYRVNRKTGHFELEDRRVLATRGAYT
jgi:hypothetical protein